MQGRQRFITVCLFAIYLIVITWVIVFKFQLSPDTLPSGRSINLKPFHFVGRGRSSFFIRDMTYNALAFIPYGIYIGMLKKGQSVVRKIMPIVLTSLLFEAVQYVFAIGATDINDLISNTAGGILGICIFHVFWGIFRDRAYTVLNVLMFTATVLVFAVIGYLSLFITYRF